MWVLSLGQEHSLEKVMATHSSILAWRIPKERGAWQAIVYRVIKSRTQLKQLSQHAVIELGFLDDSVVKNTPTMQETRVWSLDEEDPPEKEIETTAVFLPVKSYGQRKPGRLQHYKKIGT